MFDSHYACKIAHKTNINVLYFYLWFVLVMSSVAHHQGSLLISHILSLLFLLHISCVETFSRSGFNNKYKNNIPGKQQFQGK